MSGYASTPRYEDRLLDAYKMYVNLLPLDIKDCSPKSAVAESWRKNNQYSIGEFARQVSALAQSNNIDDYVHRSGGDFDNLALIVSSAIDLGLVKVSQDGFIESRRSMVGDFDSSEVKNTFTPNSDYNQFPCDESSVRRRKDMLLNRYPYTDKMSIGIIGDDDFLSLHLANLSQFDVTLVEKDKRIIDEIAAHYEHVDRVININELDIADLSANVPSRGFDTFITDPPYTLDGSLAFIYCGLSMMTQREDDAAEFYVILNPTMMGGNLNKVISILAGSGVYLNHVEQNFSQYLLPDNFNERDRADTFLRSKGVSGHKALKYSSSSSLYRFVVSSKLSLANIKSCIDTDKMYVHYNE